VGAVALLCAIALLAAAMIPGVDSAASIAARARRDVASTTGSGRRSVRETRVVGSSLAAGRYAAVATAIENGVVGHGHYVSNLEPIDWHRIRRPIARYKLYAVRWAARLGRDVRSLTAALRAGERRAGERDWTVAFADYLHLGAVYGFLPDGLEDRLAEMPPSTGSSRFPGLHRIEKGLWTGQPPRSLVPAARAVSRAVVTLRHAIPSIWVGSFDYTLRGHEIMEDAQRDLMSGLEVPWSHSGVAATAASLAAEREVIRTLTPVLRGRNNTLGVAQYWLARMARALDRVRRPDGTYPTLDELSQSQRALLQGTLAGTCAALSAVPDTLELNPLPRIPRDPAAP